MTLNPILHSLSVLILSWAVWRLFKEISFTNQLRDRLGDAESSLRWWKERHEGVVDANKSQSSVIDDLRRELSNAAKRKCWNGVCAECGTSRRGGNFCPRCGGYATRKAVRA